MKKLALRDINRRPFFIGSCRVDVLQSQLFHKGSAFQLCFYGKTLAILKGDISILAFFFARICQVEAFILINQ